MLKQSPVCGAHRRWNRRGKQWMWCGYKIKTAVCNVKTVAIFPGSKSPGVDPALGPVLSTRAIISAYSGKYQCKANLSVKLRKNIQSGTISGARWKSKTRYNYLYQDQ